jgi:hypothetical protein
METPMPMLRVLVIAAAAFVAGLAVHATFVAPPVAAAQSATRVFELRTYTAPEGKLDALNARFRDHTLGLFQKHGITNVGYWTPMDGPTAQNTLIYVIAHKSREAAKASWSAFQADPAWQKARTASEVNGRLTVQGGVQSVFLTPTDYSPLK